jgi:hypothetical protein
VYTRSAAEVAEMTRAELEADGIRVFRGVYRSCSVPMNLLTAVEAAQAVLPVGALASHRTAAALLGAPVPAGPPYEFTVRPGVYRARRPRLRIHVRALKDDDEKLIGEIPVTSGPQTWLDLASLMPADELVAVGDALYRAGHLDADTLAERLSRANGVRGILLARKLAPLLTPLSASRPESLLRYWLIDSDLPNPVPQVPIIDRWGRVVVHADLGYEEWKVALEYEGRQHAERKQFGQDLGRYTLMAADGWLVLRFGELDLPRRPRVLQRVADALRSRGARW